MVGEKVSLERVLAALGSFQYRHYKKIIAASIILTLFLAYGVTELRFQGNIEKEMPKDLPVFVLQEKIASKFRGEDFLVVAVCLNRDTGAEGVVSDIRDPRVIRSLVELQDKLEDEPLVVGKVQSVAMLFQHGIPPDIEGVKRVLAAVPGSERFFNRDYSITLVQVPISAGLSEDKVREVTGVIQKDVESITKPPGVEYKITGAAPLIVELLRMMREDMVFTTLVAAGILFVLLIFLERSFTKGLLVFLPLSLSIIWTFGTMGLLGIPVSISTVTIGAITLGLGVEYGIFMVSRYYEERGRHDPPEALKIAVSNIGASTFGSASTTIAAFLALTLSVMPMIQHLGQSLALSMGFCWLAAVVVNPCFVLLEERMNSRKSPGGLRKLVGERAA